RLALEEFRGAPLVAPTEIAYYLTKFVSGFGHAAIAFLLLRSRRAEPGGGAAELAGPANGGIGFLSYLLAPAAATVLSLGTLWFVHWSILELFRSVYQGLKLA